MDNIEMFQSNIDKIVKKTLELFPTAMGGDVANRTFFFKDGEVDYYYYLGQIALDDACFFTIRDCEVLDPGDYGYRTTEDLLEDSQFIEDQYKDQIEYALEEHILKLSL